MPCVVISGVHCTPSLAPPLLTAFFPASSSKKLIIFNISIHTAASFAFHPRHSPQRTAKFGHRVAQKAIWGDQFTNELCGERGMALPCQCPPRKGHFSYFFPPLSLPSKRSTVNPIFSYFLEANLRFFFTKNSANL